MAIIAESRATLRTLLPEGRFYRINVLRRPDRVYFNRVFVAGVATWADEAVFINKPEPGSGITVINRDFLIAARTLESMHIGAIAMNEESALSKCSLPSGYGLHKAAHLGWQKPVVWKELRSIVAAELIERKFLHPPAEQKLTEFLETLDIVSHQDGVYLQRHALASGSLQIGQRIYVLLELLKQTRPATSPVIDVTETVNADHDFGKIIDDAFCNASGPEGRAVSRDTDFQTKLAYKSLGGVEQGEPQEWFAANPADQSLSARPV